MPRPTMSWRNLMRLNPRQGCSTIALDVLIVGGIVSVSILIGTSTI